MKTKADKAKAAAYRAYDVAKAKAGAKAEADEAYTVANKAYEVAWEAYVKASEAEGASKA